MTLLVLLGSGLVSAEISSLAEHCWSFNNDASPLADECGSATLTDETSTTRTQISGTNYAYDFDGTDYMSFGSLSFPATTNTGSVCMRIKIDENSSVSSLIFKSNTASGTDFGGIDITADSAINYKTKSSANNAGRITGNNVIFLFLSCFFKRSAATAYPKNKSLEFSSSTK